ncbi:hypothetical protein [Oscillibacter sp.]|uniref:hypothetical protein n=1 Tax=Oscillibacter sp. TaxID=1945593 RepID=UPI0028B0E550|nr:hypothetical protein [Oscillibacter sp.]
MRKMKKINGYLVVRFNDREKREYETLGSFGVIAAEEYTGDLDMDRDVMEYDDADSLEVAVEQARGLNAEEDYTGLPATCTVIRETDHDTEMNQVDPQLMITGWTEELTQQVNNRHYPDMDARTAAHELYGYKMALVRMGLIDADEAYVLPNTFEAATAPTVATDAAHPFDFLHQLSDAPTWRLYELGRALEKDCPENDCILYRNIFKMSLELDDALDFNSGCAQETLKRQLRAFQREMNQMYWENYAVTSYREQLRAQKHGPSVTLTPHKSGDGGTLTLPMRSNIPHPKNADWKLTTCPVCGAECWESDLARQALAAEPDLRAACTSCALKENVRGNNDRA